MCTMILKSTMIFKTIINIEDKPDELVSGADEPSKYCVLAVFFTSYIFIINLSNREMVIIDK